MHRKSWAQRQMATIYSLANFAGSWSERTENCPDFRTCDSTIGDNVVSSTCVTGIWIFYSERNYNSGDFGTVEWVFGDNYCWNLGPTDNDVSSLRYVGRQDNWKEDAITLYGLTVFAGSAHLDLIDSSNVPMSSVQSIIISGESDWTVYS
ncbi:unnamed protein product [Darwinula stevensoni]|uniref:Beta/gamma crystallin 'Greek key' domain-containing protein n=1 Tax=Darwinula stevensoni TaxID=69355 RepID=A0A7R9A3N7_9CRUS|nr:unnamed protein product [Darwinula stevensoni]CAG0881708.1 unnamed protein product [Darwinula stevensoni]